MANRNVDILVIQISTCIIFCSISLCASINLFGLRLDFPLLVCLQLLRFTLSLRFLALESNLISPLAPITKSISTTSASRVELTFPSFEHILISSSSTSGRLLQLLDVELLLVVVEFCEPISMSGSITRLSSLSGFALAVLGGVKN